MSTDQSGDLGRIGYFHPFPAIQPRSNKLSAEELEEVFVNQFNIYGDMFLEKLIKSYPNIPMHRKFKKPKTDYLNGREMTRILVYSIREGKSLMKRLSPFTKVLLDLESRPFYPQTLKIYDLELKSPKNRTNIEQIISELNEHTRMNVSLEPDPYPIPVILPFQKGYCLE